MRDAVIRVQARCRELYTYLANNMDSLTDYGRRYRNGLAVSSSRAEGCVDDIGNTRMGKRRRMRWSPKGAHRVAVVRAAVLDGRLTSAYHRRQPNPQVLPTPQAQHVGSCYSCHDTACHLAQYFNAVQFALAHDDQPHGHTPILLDRRGSVTFLLCRCGTF